MHSSQDASDIVADRGGWDACTAPCGGGGTQARSYAISQPAHHGGAACPEVHGAREWQACNEMPCDAVLHCAGGWGAWSGCSALCGGGTRSQAYSVSTEARNGGRACAAAAGDTLVEPCNIAPCPVNCEGAWGAWGQCDRPCGGGEQSRSYRVTTASAHGGIPCVAEQWQTRSCNTAGCGAPSVNCMGRWGEWGVCSEPCGGGSHSRSYSQSQSAQRGGTSCPEPHGETESQPCNEDPCPPTVSSTFELNGADLTDEAAIQQAVAAATGVDLDSVEVTDLYEAVASQMSVTGSADTWSSAAALAQFGAGLATALGVSADDVEITAVDGGGQGGRRRRELQESTAHDLLLRFSVRAAGDAATAALQSSISAASFASSVASGVSKPPSPPQPQPPPPPGLPN